MRIHKYARLLGQKEVGQILRNFVNNTLPNKFCRHKPSDVLSAENVD